MYILRSMPFSRITTTFERSFGSPASYVIHYTVCTRTHAYTLLFKYLPLHLPASARSRTPISRVIGARGVDQRNRRFWKLALPGKHTTFNTRKVLAVKSFWGNDFKKWIPFGVLNYCFFFLFVLLYFIKISTL